MSHPTADYIVTNHGSIFLVEPRNDDARSHLVEHVSDEAQWFGRMLAVEPRYVDNLIEGLRNEGYEVV